MIIREVSYGGLTTESAMRALARINETEADDRVKTVKFVELCHGPDYGQMTAAQKVASEMVQHGIGVRLNLEWNFRGTQKWALQTDRTRIVST